VLPCELPINTVPNLDWKAQVLTSRCRDAAPRLLAVGEGGCVGELGWCCEMWSGVQWVSELK
jgi:predicted metal-binding transcription factor (methanogenesis marker protein 9)